MPGNEAERIEALKSYHVLDTAPEQAYDQLTALAGYIGDVPVALISLVDESRQWFKSKLGWTRPQTSRDAAFCAHAILKSKPLIICDTVKDRRFAANPLVVGEPHVRFYAGFPLVNSERLVLGTLCVIDHRPRRLSARQKRALQALAAQAMTLLEHRRVLSRLAQALEHVKTLQGLLSICSWCKRIRDGNGGWSQVDAYLREHVGANFSHGICPECLKEQFPEPAA